MSDWCRARVAKARALVGTKFRPQGRDPAIGLDCVGLVRHVFALPPSAVSRNYRLNGDHSIAIFEQLGRWFESVSCDEAEPADVLVCAVSGRQQHLAMDCVRSFIHADAGLRRVVNVPGKPPWPILARFRWRHSIESS